ncbi:PD40 domain-containing protein [Candidatus Poribacteria bacterium]|nr:PD40 domain-containing protein [Candidatus Poribacteria bacterium]
MKRTLVLCGLSLIVLLSVGICAVSAKAPTMPKILFTSARDGNYEIYMMNPDGTEQVNLTQDRDADVGAVWSPTGEQILFTSDRDGVRDLYLMDPDGDNVRRVFKKEAYRSDPAWSPDGKQITYAYAEGLGSPDFIHIATLGDQKEQLVATGFYPAWSPDGTEIAYISYVPIGHARRVRFVDIRTRKLTRLLPKEAMDWQNSPSWLGTSDKLVFSWNKHPLPPDFNPLKDRFPPAWRNKETIYIVNRDGTDLQQLVDEAGSYAQYPASSPNGEDVLYTQAIDGHFQIFKIDVNSGIRTQLTHIVGRNLGGNWFDPAYALPVSPKPHLLTTTWADVKTHKLH